MPKPVQQSMYIDPVDSNDIKDIINKLKPEISTGFDSISCKLLKLSAVYILVPLTHIINLSITTGIVPEQMKIAKVIPIFKMVILQTRQLINQLAFYKILERVIYNKTLKYIE